MNSAVMHFDGGCSPNPGAKYGSYSILFDGCFLLQVQRKSFGVGTSNEAEWDALLAALKLLHDSCARAFVLKSRVKVQIFTDSTIVRNWINGFERANPEKIKNDRRQVMFAYAKNTVELLKAFHSFKIEWNSRDVNVEKFGH